MGSNSSDDVIIPRADEAECSETTVEIKIKTLDSQTYTLRVNKRVPVPQLKEQIEIVTGVLSEQQRLICRGKVLKDDQLLSAYHVEDGHTLHMVVRQPIPPPSASTTGSVGSDGLPIPQAADPASTTGQNRGNPVAHSVVLGTFNVADQGEGGMPDLNRILSAVFSSIGIPNIGNSSEGVDLREAGLNRLETIGLSSMLDSTRQQHDARTMRVQYDPLHGAIQLPTAVSSGPLQPPVIPDSLTTLSQYLIYLRREFIANGGGHAVDAGMHGHEEQNYNATLGSVSAQGGLPTPATLAEVMLSTRQLLIEQAGECLSQLARQLEDQANVTTPPLRNGIQTSAMRSGALLQNLGALLLELGRTTMTLRMGQSPSDAVVNAGPAVFISTSGPNPIMVQPLPFQPGMGFSANHTGSLSAGSGLVGGSLGSGFIPRNIDIRIRTGHSMSTANVNQGEQSGTQQTSGQTGSERGPSNANFVHRVAAGVSGGQPFAREAEVRMLPVRTVVAAVPAAVSRSTSDSSNNSMGLFYPLLARVQQVTPGQTNNARGSQSSGVRNNNIPETDHRAIPDSAMQQQNLESNSEAPVRVGGSETANLFPTLAASAISLASPSNTASQHHQEGLATPNSSRQEPPGSNNHYTSGCETQNGEESVVRILGTSEQLPSAIFPSEQIHVSDIDFQVLPTTESTLPQRGTARDTERREEAPRLGTDDGIFLSRLIHQIMPYISHTSATEPNTSSQERVDVSEHRVAQDTSRQTQENSVGVGTSHSRSDPPPSPRSSKRQKVQSE